ncbi:ABC transporter ATP-binding protein/permease [Patescibacteria group bacterium]|nr:ABC transporter ATP-binding protein/permease [Patescibacteria group bacterium]
MNTSELKNIGKRLFGIQSNTLIDGSKLAPLANKLNTPDTAQQLLDSEKRRILPRTLQIITQTSTTAMLYFLSNNRFMEAGICGGIALTSYVVSAYFTNTNASLMQTAMRDLNQSIEEHELGISGKDMSDSLRSTIEYTGEERKLYLRLGEIDFWYIVQSLAVILGTRESILPYIVGASASYALTSLIEPIFINKFRKSDEEFRQAESMRLKKSTEENISQYDKKLKTRSLSTLPINLIDKFLSLVAYMVAKGGVNTGLFATVMAQLISGFSSKTTRSSDISVTKNRLKELYMNLGRVIDALEHEIVTDDDIAAHIKKSSETFPEDVEQRIKKLKIGSAIIINAVMRNLDTEPKAVMAIIPTDDIVVFIGDNGSGKSSLIRMIGHYNDLHDGSVGFVQNGKLVNAHDAKRKCSIHISKWRQHDFETTIGNFLDLTGLTFDEAYDYFKKSVAPMDINNFIIDFQKLLNIDVGLGGVLSEGERKFVMLSAFIYKAIEQKNDYIFVDEIFAMLKDDVNNRFKDCLVRQLRYAQSQGVKVILAVQNRADIPEGVDESHVVDFSGRSIRHYPKSTAGIFASAQLFVNKIYLDSGIRDDDSDGDPLVDKLITMMEESGHEEDVIVKVVGTVLLSDRPKKLLTQLRLRYQLTRLNTSETTLNEVENFYRNWIATIIRLAEALEMRVSEFLKYINFGDPHSDKFNELLNMYTPYSLYDKLIKLWEEILNDH